MQMFGTGIAQLPQSLIRLIALLSFQKVYPEGCGAVALGPRQGGEGQLKTACASSSKTHFALHFELNRPTSHA
jgi:hypothetical protein